MLVDDEADIIRQQTRLFEKYEDIEVVATATSGDEAIRLAKEIRPDVILLDLGMPVTDGIAVTQAVKSSAPEVEILIFTVFDEEDKVLEAVQAGAAGYLLKDTPFLRVVEALREIHEGGSIIQPHLARKLLKFFRNPQETKSGLPEEEIPKLTQREQEILNLISKGLSNKEVAGVLGLSPSTVRTHLEHIYAKLDVTNRTEAVTEGIRHKLIDVD